jgi:zinc protease
MIRPLLCAGLLLAAPAASALEPAVHREVLPGDLELLVIPVEEARTVSLRYVVRAGSLQDPPGKDGLAHLLEHLLVRGAPGAESLVEAARAAGANLNAYTSREVTTYVLDAPAEAFGPLAERLVRAITNPVLQAAQIDKELGVIGQEGARAEQGVLGFVEEVVYRSLAPVGTTLGRSSSRAGITRADLVEFFQRHYATGGTTIVLSGPVTPEAARQLVDRAVLVPPSLPGEAPERSVTSPPLPVTEKLRAPFIAAVSGYALAPEDRATCSALAAVIELKMFVALYLKEPLLRSISVGCYRLRGTDFLLAFGQAPTLEATELPAVLERIFLEAAFVPPGPQERKHLEKRLGREREQALLLPEALADSAASSAIERRPGGGTEVPLLAPVRIPAEAMRATGRRSFTPERRVLVLLSPFEG